MGLRCSLGVMAILLAEALITLGAPLSVGANVRKLRYQSFHQQAADELGGNKLSGAREERLGEVLGERGGYGDGFVRKC